MQITSIETAEVDNNMIGVTPDQNVTIDYIVKPEPPAKGETIKIWIIQGYSSGDFTSAYENKAVTSDFEEAKKKYLEELDNQIGYIMDEYGVDNQEILFPYSQSKEGEWNSDDTRCENYEEFQSIVVKYIDSTGNFPWLSNLSCEFSNEDENSWGICVETYEVDVPTKK